MKAKPIIRVSSRTGWKDAIDQKPHVTLSRRDFLSRGLLTGTATVMLPHALAALLARQALGDSTSCPPQASMPGGLAQIYRDGGPTVGAMFLNQMQVNSMNSTMASNYGIVGASDIVQAGANWYLAKTSPFAVALMTPPPGFSQSQWNAVLMKTSLGGHYGPFNADDGAGENTGLLGAASPFKTSVLGKDLRVNNSATLASWSQGTPSTGVSGSPKSLTSAKLASNFGITPAGKITSAVMTNAAQAADSLSQIFMNIFGTAGRAGGTDAVSKAVCGFYGDSAMADPSFGNSLFNPSQISALTSAIQVGNLSAEQQALLAAFYQSARGTLGGVILQQNGQDYHGQSVQNTIAPADFEAGQMVAMFLAACAVAGSKGALISLHNGQAIASGTQNVTVNGQNVNGPVAQGDAGGAYNAGFVLCYDPSSPPQLGTTGNFNASNGNVSPSSSVPSNVQAVAGLYLTAFAHLGLDVNNASLAMQSVGAITNASNVMLIS